MQVMRVRNERCRHYPKRRTEPNTDERAEIPKFRPFASPKRNGILSIKREFRKGKGIVVVYRSFPERVFLSLAHKTTTHPRSSLIETPVCCLHPVTISIQDRPR